MSGGPPTSSIDVPLRRLKFGETRRRDNWWVKPLVVFTLLGGFVVYATWAALQNGHYTYGPYLSPMYSPLLFGGEHAWISRAVPGWWPHWLPWSPAIIILWAPGGFRVTCYYYRGAYYKAFWASPPACAVGKPQKNYRGEQKLPLILQNVHRWFLYLALLFLVVLSYDAYKAFFGWETPDGHHHLEIHLGSIVMLLNVLLLAGYTFGCHSLRHLVGGGCDEMSRRPLRHALWKAVTWFNCRHQGWAWPSLIWVSLTDVYVRLCAHGIVHDYGVRIF